MPRVLIAPAVFQNPAAPFFQAMRDAGLELVFPPNDRHSQDSQALIQLLQGIDATMASTEKYTPEVIAKTNLRVIARTGVGYDSVDVPAATAANVAVTITPGAVDVSVAEHTLALILGVYRDVVGRDREVRAGKWSRKSLPRIAGKTLAIVGMGRIGRAVVPRAQGLGLNVIAHDPFPHHEFAAAHNVRMGTLDEVLSEADIVSLHMPCTPETTNLINARTLGLMKPDAVLVNTGRGGLVDEDALFTAMRDGHLFGAALDVFKQEPLPTESRLLELPNVLLATHTAGLDDQSMIDMPRIAAECIANLYLGQWPEHCVINRELGPDWKW